MNLFASARIVDNALQSNERILKFQFIDLVVFNFEYGNKFYVKAEKELFARVRCLFQNSSE